MSETIINIEEIWDEVDDLYNHLSFAATESLNLKLLQATPLDFSQWLTPYATVSLAGILIESYEEKILHAVFVCLLLLLTRI